MKAVLAALCLALLGTGLSGCGSSVDKAALAHKTVQQYWDDVSHAHTKQAYTLLTTGTRSATPYGTYAQDMLSFLRTVSSLSARAGKARVKGDEAIVPVTLRSIVTSAPLKACNHLFWQDGGWRITDQDGGLSHACSGV